MLPIDIDFSRLCEVFTYDPQAPLIFTSGIFLWLFAAFMVVYVFLQYKYTARILLLPCFLIISIIKVAVRTFSCWHLSLWVILYLHV